ncbi:unnamed protein product [Mortierella alpina]
MNTTAPYDQQQQQQQRQQQHQQQQSYSNRQLSSSALLSHKPAQYGAPNLPAASASTSFINLNASVGRPLPRTPVPQQQHHYNQQQQFLYQDSAAPTSASQTSGDHAGFSYQNSTSTAMTGSGLQNGASGVYNSSSNATSARSSRVSIHIGQQPAVSFASTNNVNGNSSMGKGAGTKTGHSSWLLPKTASSASTSLSTFPSSLPSGATASESTISTSTAPLGRRMSQPHPYQPQQQASSTARHGLTDDASGYYTALTRPISPTMVMNYIPPPANNATQTGSSPEALVHSTTPSPSTASSHHPSLRPMSATVALSSSFNTFSSGSQPVQKPAILQGARSSYITSGTPITPSTGAGTQSKTSSSPMSSETPASSSSRFARRGPLVMSQDNSSFAEGVDGGMNSGGAKSRRQSAAYSDAESPAQHQYIQSVQGQQPFSPASQRTDTGGSLLPGAAGTQLQIAKEGWLWRRGNLLTWKRCYAMGRYRGDTQPGIFTLFKDNEHLFPIKTIDMSECFEVQVKAQDAKGTGRFEFKVVTRKEETWFATDTMSERTGWIDALNSLMAKVVGASLMKLEQKLNNIRHRNHSLEYAHTPLPVEKASMEGHLQLVQHDLAVREQQLSQRELDLEKKRVESLLVQLEAWRAAAKVTVNQHYSVRDQLLERVMKATRTFQELQERAKIHLETGSDQVIEVVNSHLDCLKVHASEATMSPASFRMLKSILVGLTVNLDTRSSEIKRVLLVMEQYISATKAAAAAPRTSSMSSPSSPVLAGSHTSARERRISVAEPPYHTKTPSPTPSMVGMSVYLIQIKEKYTTTLEILEEHSRQMKRVLERVDVQSADHVRKFHEEAREVLRSLLNLPAYAFTPCIPDQPLPGAPDTFYREDLVQLQQQSQEILRRGHSLNGQPASAQSAHLLDKSQDASLRDNGVSRTTTRTRTPENSEPPTVACESAVKPQPRASTPSSSSGPPTLPLALPPSLSSFLLPDKSTFGASTADLTQRLRDTILPEFDHLSIKQEESTQSMTLLLNQISSQLVNKLAEIKDATASQRQEFEELKDEIIDVMQLSATDPSAPQRDISTLSEIRSKLAEITEQLNKVQSAQSQAGGATYLGAGNGSYRRMGPPLRSSGASMGESAATTTGFSLLQRSASTLGHSSMSGGAHPFYHTIDNNARQHLQRVNSTSLQSRLHIPTSASLSAGIGAGGLASTANSAQGRHPKIAGMAQKFEEGDTVHGHLGLPEQADRQPQASWTNMSAPLLFDKDSIQQDHFLSGQIQVVSKLDQLLLLLEFVNTAQCRMMAYQDLEFDRGMKGGYGTNNVDDGRMMAVQEHMEQLDRKMSLQMHLLRRLVTLQGPEPLSDTGSVTKTQETDNSGGARLRELSDEDVLKECALSSETEKGETVAPQSPSSLPSSSMTLGEVDVIVKELPSERELTLIEVLGRLDLQVIPSVRDQSGRIQELADQLSEMKRQLDEQQRRQGDHQLRSGGTLKTRVSSPSRANRSRSSERPVTPLLHSRSPSQPLGLISSSVNPSPSPLETENPAFWRASLRPSASNGSSYSGSVRERAGAQSTGALPNASTTSGQVSHGGGSNAQEASATALAGNPPWGSWNHSLQHQTSFGSSSSLITKTSDRIAEMLERMDARMSQVIDEQLARYEKGNKELLAKVYDLLDADDDENEDDDEEGDVPVQAKLRTRQDSSPRQGTSASPLLMDTTAPFSGAQVQQEQHQIADVKELLEKVLRGQDDLLRTSRSSDRTNRLQHEEVKASEEDDDPRRQGRATGGAVEGSSPLEELPMSMEMSESLDKVKELIQQEGDRSEATLNEQRDEVLEKMNQLLSVIQESRADQDERGAGLKEELQEMREWIVRHSNLQTENLREIVLAASTAGTREDVTVASLERGEANDSLGEADGVLVGHGGGFSGPGSSGSDQEEYAAVDISDDLDMDRAVHHPHPTTSVTTSSSSDIRELKEQLEMFTKIQMATFSELADNVSGVERMMRDMSKVMGVRRGGTILRKKEADQDRAMLAMEVKEKIEEVMTRIGSTATTANPQQPRQLQRWSTSIGMGRSSSESDHPLPTGSNHSTVSRNEGSGLLKYLYQPRRSVSMVPTSTASTLTMSTIHSEEQSDIVVDTTHALENFSHAPLQSPTGSALSDDQDHRGINMSRVQTTSMEDAKLQMQLQLESHQDHIEQLYKRKARTEIEVENLQIEKQRLREEVEQLRREKQALLLETRCATREADVSTTMEEGASESSVGMLLEKMLQARVAMLLQETARLEARKIQLEEEP